jgi:hypothetical protein
MALFNNILMKYSLSINFKHTIFIAVASIVLYTMYFVSYAPNTVIVNMPMATEDSPYLSPEGWPLPYPYVPIIGN